MLRNFLALKTTSVSTYLDMSQFLPQFQVYVEKNVPFIWSAECKKAARYLKKALIEQLLLTSPDFCKGSHHEVLISNCLLTHRDWELELHYYKVIK